MSCEIIHPARFQRVTDTDDPNRDPPAAAALTNPPGFRQREYSIHDIARFLGIYDRTSRTIVRHVRDMIALRAMPGPKGVRIIRPTAADAAPRILEGADAVDIRSRWDATLFDCWNRTRLSPTQRAALERHETSLAAAALDANAQSIYG